MPDRGRTERHLDRGLPELGCAELAEIIFTGCSDSGDQLCRDFIWIALSVDHVIDESGLVVLPDHGATGRRSAPAPLVARHATSYAQLVRWVRRRPSKEILASYDQPIGQPVVVQDSYDEASEYPGRIIGPARFGPTGDVVYCPVRMERTGDVFLVSYGRMYEPDHVDIRWEHMQPIAPLTEENSPTLLMRYFIGGYRYYEWEGGSVPDMYWRP